MVDEELAGLQVTPHGSSMEGRPALKIPRVLILGILNNDPADLQATLRSSPVEVCPAIIIPRVLFLYIFQDELADLQMTLRSSPVKWRPAPIITRVLVLCIFNDELADLIESQRSIGCVTQLLSFPFFLPRPAGAEMKYGSKIHRIQADPLRLWDSALNTIA